MTMNQLVIAASCVYGTGFLILVYFCRPKRLRLLGALAGGIAVAILGVGIEITCQTLGFWHYPSTDQRTGPLAIYPLLVLVWMILSLIGWKILRRFGMRGWLIYLATITVIGTIRDYVLAQEAFAMIVLAPGVATVIVDAFCWASLTALAQIVMRGVSGPSTKDALARWPWENSNPNA